MQNSGGLDRTLVGCEELELGFLIGDARRMGVRSRLEGRWGSARQTTTTVWRCYRWRRSARQTGESGGVLDGVVLYFLLVSLGGWGGEVGDRIDDGSTMDQAVGGDLGGRVEVILLKWLIDDSKPCALKSSND